MVQPRILCSRHKLSVAIAAVRPFSANQDSGIARDGVSGLAKCSTHLQVTWDAAFTAKLGC